MPQVAFRGVFPILVTPFLQDEGLDLESMGKVVRFMRQAGMDGVTILGVLGEANRLTDAEREQVIRTTIAAADTMPVVVGTSHFGTTACVALCQMAQNLGAAAVMITPHHEPTPSDAKVMKHFETIAQNMSLPIVLQDHPTSSRVFMPIELLVHLVNEIPSIQCIKEEHPPTPQKATALLKALPKERGITLLQGLGALYGMFDLEAGCHGFMTGFAIPEVLKAMTNTMVVGNPEGAWAIFKQYLPLIVYEQQPGLAIRKEIYRLRGLIESNCVRAPGATINPSTAGQLQQLLQRVLGSVDYTKPIVVTTQ